jgi:PAS domain S-box-containing protein
MNATSRESFFQLSATEAREELQLLLKALDLFILDLKGDPDSESARSFRALLTTQSEGLIEHLKILSAIFYISSLFSSHSGLSEVLSLIAESVKHVLNFRRVIILLLNEEQTVLRCEVNSGLSYDQSRRTASRPFLMDKHDCIETKVARFGKSYLITNINDQRLTSIDRRTIIEFERGCTIYVPIKSKNGIMGVLGVDRQSLLPPLQPRDVGRVQLFANYIGVLIENAKLYESIIDHKNRFENIVRQTPNGIITTDSNGKITLVNRSAEKLLGIEKADFLSLPVEDLLGSDIMTKVRDVLSKQDQAQFYDLDFECTNSRTLILNLFALNIESARGSGLLIILQDMTEKKTIDKHLQTLDRLASIGTMAAGIAHEIRNPLTSISMDLDSLYESASDKERVQDTIVKVLEEIERMDNIVSNLLQFARPTSDEHTMLSIRKVIDESISLVRRKIGQKRIQFRTHFMPACPDVSANPGRLKQMLINLLTNAVEAIEREGVIAVRTDILNEHNGLMSRALEDSTFRKCTDVLKISVEDNGSGVPAEFKDKIFDPYFTTKPQGTGLGLAIVSKIAREHQGYVYLAGEPGKNTLFEVFFPAITSEDERLPEHESHSHR